MKHILVVYINRYTYELCTHSMFEILVDLSVFSSSGSCHRERTACNILMCAHFGKGKKKKQYTRNMRWHRSRTRENIKTENVSKNIVKMIMQILSLDRGVFCLLCVFGKCWKWLEVPANRLYIIIYLYTYTYTAYMCTVFYTLNRPVLYDSQAFVYIQRTYGSLCTRHVVQ